MLRPTWLILLHGTVLAEIACIHQHVSLVYMVVAEIKGDVPSNSNLSAITVMTLIPHAFPVCAVCRLVNILSLSLSISNIVLAFAVSILSDV